MITERRRRSKTKKNIKMGRIWKRSTRKWRTPRKYLKHPMKRTPDLATNTPSPYNPSPRGLATKAETHINPHPRPAHHIRTPPCYPKGTGLPVTVRQPKALPRLGRRHKALSTPARHDQLLQGLNPLRQGNQEQPAASLNCGEEATVLHSQGQHSR